MPALKKDPSTRRRRNKAPGAATLSPRQLTAVPDPVDYSGLTVVKLRAEIDERNADRPDDKHLSKRGAKAALIAALQADDIAAADNTPELPERADGWTARTIAWWRDVWSSPMSDEWDESDLHNLFLCALLYDDMWTATSPKGRKDAASEFRLQCARLGLDPYSRRRLEWQIEATSEAQDKGEQRRQRQQATGASQQGAPVKKPDPRAGLASVN